MKMILRGSFTYVDLRDTFLNMWISENPNRKETTSHREKWEEKKNSGGEIDKVAASGRSPEGVLASSNEDIWCSGLLQEEKAYFFVLKIKNIFL